MHKIIFQVKIFKLKNLPRVANLLLDEIKLPASIIFEGELASGKTTLIRELASKIRINKMNINSPTFNIVNQHSGKIKGFKISLNHFDLYRLDDSEELIELPFDYFFKKKYLNCIEWGKKFLPTIYDFSERLYILEIQRDINIEKEEYRILTLYLLENLINN